MKIKTCVISGLVLGLLILFISRYALFVKQHRASSPAAYEPRADSSAGSHDNAAYNDDSEPEASEDTEYISVIDDALMQMYGFDAKAARAMADDDTDTWMGGDSIRGFLSEPYTQGNTRKHLLLTQIGYVYPMAGHVSAPHIGAAVISIINGRTCVESRVNTIDTGHSMGAWGHLSEWHFVRAGPEKMAVLFDHWGGNQGYFSGRYELLAETGPDRFGIIADLDGGMDYSGAGKDPYYRTSLHTVEHRITHGLYHLKLEYFPIGGLYDSYPVEYFRFNGTEYVRYDSCQAHIEPDTIRARQNRFQSSLM